MQGIASAGSDGLQRLLTCFWLMMQWAAGFQTSKETCTWHRSSQEIGNILLPLVLSHEVSHPCLAYSHLLEVRRTFVVRSSCVKTFLHLCKMKNEFSASEVEPGQISVCMSLVSFCLLFFLQRPSTKSPFLTSNQSIAVRERQCGSGLSAFTHFLSYLDDLNFLVGLACGFAG